MKAQRQDPKYRNILKMYSLPNSLEVSGKIYPINADFRNVLIIFQAFNDSNLSEREKAYICIKRLYTGNVPVSEEALKKAYWFCDGGDMPKSEPEHTKTVDWQHDESIICPAVSKVLGIIDVRSLPFLHWWTFLSAFGEIGDGLFSQVMNIRHKLAQGKKIEKYEREFIRKNRELIILRTAEEQAELDETRDFLEKIT